MTYKWAIGGSFLRGAVRATLRLPSTSSGKLLSCRATVINAKGRTFSQSKAVRVRFLAAPVARTRPALVTVPKVGGLVKVTKGRWSLTPFAYRYRFLVNGRQVALVSRNSLAMYSGWRGRTLVVEVRAYVRGHAVGKALTRPAVIR